MSTPYVMNLPSSGTIGSSNNRPQGSEERLKTAVKDLRRRLVMNAVEQITQQSTETKTPSSYSMNSTASAIDLMPVELVETINGIGGDYSIVIQRIAQLAEQEDGDEGDPVGQDTIRDAKWLIVEAARRLTGRIPIFMFPRAAAATDDKGSIYLYWTKGDRRLQLTVPHDQNRHPFIYHRQGDDFGFVRPAYPDELARWLDWFAK